MPAIPYRGIQPFRYEDHPIFFGREEEAWLLKSLVAVHRGVFLYGDSGIGKSSLVDAGLLPQTHGLGFDAVRVRVQPRGGAELVVDHLSVEGGDGGARALLLARADNGSTRVVLSVAEFEQRVRAAAAQSRRPLLIFDQFEEILTLFRDGDALASRQAIVEMVGRLLRDPIAVKLLFAFREDYLGRVKHLLGAHPELVDHALRLGPMQATELQTIIRGPFERHPGHFERELDPALAARVGGDLEQRFDSGEVSLSEVQTVCLRLWRAQDPIALLEQRGIQGLLEDELGEALAALRPDLRGAAVAVLSQMVTSAGTRNVISAEDVRLRVQEAEGDVTASLVDEALLRLESEAKLIRREHRRDVDLYEITSEFLVPWINQRRDEARIAKERRREELRREQERARERRRLRIFAAIGGALLLVVAVVLLFALAARKAERKADRRAADVRSLALVGASAESLPARPDVSLALAFEAYRAKQRPEAWTAVMRSLRAAEETRVRGVLTESTPLWDVAYGADGAIALAGADGAIRLRYRSGRRVVLPGHDAPVRSVAFSRDGKALASADDDGRVGLWDPATGTGEVIGKHEPGPAYAVAFDPQGRTFASGGNDGVRIWNRETGAAVSGPHGAARVGDLVFSDDRTLAYAPASGGVRLMDRGGNERRRLGPRVQAFAIALSPHGTLAAAGADKTIRLWRLSRRTGRPRMPHRELGAGAKRIRSLAFTRDGNMLAGAGEDRLVRLWDPSAGRSLARLRGHSLAVLGVAFSPDGRSVVSAGIDSTLRRWDSTMRNRTPGRDDRARMRSVAFSPDGKTLAAGGRDGRLEFRRPPAARQSVLLDRGTHTISEVAFSSDGKTVAYTADDGKLRLRGTGAHAQPSAVDDLQGEARDVTFGQDGLIAWSGEDETIRLWSTRTAKALPPMDVGRDRNVNDIAFSGDGRTLAAVSAPRLVLSASKRRPLHLWDISTGKQLTVPIPPAGGANAVAFSGRGRIAYAPSDNTIRLFDMTRRQIGRALVGHTGKVSALAFSPDGKTLASGSEDRTVRLWDVAAQRQTGRLDGHRESVLSVAFSHDGGTLASASDDDVELWKLWRTPHELKPRVCGVLSTGIIGRVDWNQYAPDIPYRRSCP